MRVGGWAWATLAWARGKESLISRGTPTALGFQGLWKEREGRAMSAVALPWTCQCSGHLSDGCAGTRLQSPLFPNASAEAAAGAFERRCRSVPCCVRRSWCFWFGRSVGQPALSWCRQEATVPPGAPVDGACEPPAGTTHRPAGGPSQVRPLRPLCLQW